MIHDAATRMFWRNVKARSTEQADTHSPTLMTRPEAADAGVIRKAFSDPITSKHVIIYTRRSVFQAACKDT